MGLLALVPGFLSRKKYFAAAVFVSGVSACHPSREAASPATLPLRTVRLYETGVGYFEREGEITGGSESLPVPASHVDDALKTLVILSSQGPVSVAGVEFDSVL